MNGTRNIANANRYIPLLIIGSLFFIFGFITWVNSVLIPYFKLVCELNVKEAMLVAFAFYMSYFLMAFPASAILKKTGYKNGMVLGLLVMACGALLFVPAGSSRAYPVFLAGLFVQATGLTLLQTAANPYIIVLGPIERAAGRMSIMGVCNKLAGAIAPVLLVGAIVRNPDEIDQVQQLLLTATAPQKEVLLDDLSGRLLVPYLVIAAVLAGLALIIRLSRLPEINDNTAAGSEGLLHGKRSLFSHTYLVLGAVAIFCAVSVEVLVVDTIIQYAQYWGYSFRNAKYFASYTLITMIVSYCVGIAVIPKLITQRKALLVCALLGVWFTCLVCITGKGISLWCMVLLGFGNALLWPAIWPLALDGLGRQTSRGSALLVMAIVGGAVTPLLYGYLTGLTDHQTAYIVAVPFYLFLLYYALYGCKKGKKLSSETQ